LVGEVQDALRADVETCDIVLVEPQAGAGHNSVGLGQGDLALGASVGLEAVTVSLDLAEGAIRAQRPCPYTQQRYIPFGLAGSTESNGHPAIWQEDFGLAGVVGLGAEMDFGGVGECAVRSEAVVATVHRGDIVVGGAKAEACYHAAVGDVESEFGFLLGVDMVVE